MIVATLGTGEITDGSQAGVFTVKHAHLKDVPGVAVSLEGLGDSETATLWYRAGDSWVPANDDGGTQVEFSDTDSVRLFTGAGTYGFTKTATSSEVNVHIALS